MGAHKSQDYVRCVLLLNEDSCVLGSCCLYDSSGVNCVRRLLDCSRGYWKDSVLSPLVGTLRFAYWCSDCSVPRSLALRLLLLVHLLHNYWGTYFLLRIAALCLLAHG